MFSVVVGSLSVARSDRNVVGPIGRVRTACAWCRGLGLLAVVVLALVAGTSVRAALPPLKVSDNHRFLVTETGEPFFWLGDTAWELFHRLNRAEADRYLRDRADKGFTVIQAVVVAELDGLRSPNAYDETPFVEMDPSRPNEAYFAHVDWIVERASELGLYSALLPVWGRWVGGRDEGRRDSNFINRDNAHAYGRFLGRRYARKPVIWILGGDRSAEKTADVWHALAAGLREEIGSRQLMSYHPRRASSEFFHVADWLDFNMVQSGHSPASRNFGMIEHDYALEPVKPCLDGEPAYEYPPDAMPAKRPVGDRQVRRNAYWSVFAGAFGHTYGAHPIWQMYDAGWARTERHHNRRPRWDVTTSWHEALDLPGARQLKHLKRLMLSRPFLTRIPDQSILLSTTSDDLGRVQVTRDGRAGHRDATYIMAYFPTPAEATLDTSAIDGRRLRGWWFDPRSGTAQPLRAMENRKRMTFAPPTDDNARDWVLVIDNAAKGYPPPGTAHAN